MQCGLCLEEAIRGGLKDQLGPLTEGQETWYNFISKLESSQNTPNAQRTQST